jgi:glycosyltransferase involved in cell wall biosynthesis
LADELGMQHVVTFWGEQTDTRRFFNAADVIAMSSISEGLPMSLLQGMSRGVPMVVTDIGGMKEIVDLCRCGLKAPVGNWHVLAEGLIQLASEDSLRVELGDNGKRAFEHHFTLGQMAEQYERLYRSGRKAIS